MNDKTGKRARRSPGAQTGGSGGSGTASRPLDNRLLAQSSRVGNEAFQQRLASSNTTRDEMVEFIGSRLKVIGEVQEREVAQMSTRNERDWWKEVSDIHKGVTKPDPKQWHEATKLYQLAMEQLCHGKIGRGREILDSAMRAEEQAFNNLTKLVSIEDLEREAAEEAPDAMWEIGVNQACTPTDIPNQLAELANQIQDVGDEVKDPPVRQVVDSPWWTEEEEEEEEADADGGG